MSKIKYNVRKSRGKSWVVDELYFWGGDYYIIVQNSRYFDTEEKARAFKKLRGNE